MVPPPPYIPAAHIIAVSHLTAPELVSHFQDFSNTLVYVTTAPVLVFERLVANLSNSFGETLRVEWQERSTTLQASQRAYEDLAAGWREKSSALEQSQLANENLATQLQEKSSTVDANDLAYEILAGELQEKSSTLQARELAYENLTAGWQETYSALEQSQLANENLTTQMQEKYDTIHANELAFEILAGELQEKSGALQTSQRANEVLTASLQDKSSALQASQLAHENLAARWRVKSGDLEASQLANENLTAKLQEISSALEASQLANEGLAAELPEKSGTVHANEVAYKILAGALQRMSCALKASQLANEGLAAKLPKKSKKALQASQVANSKLTDELAKIKEIIRKPGPSGVVTVRAAVRVNPTIGAFNTHELRSCQQVCHKTSKIVSFTNKYAMVPGLVVGLTMLDVSHNANVRVKAYPNELQRDSFKINLDSWADTKLFGAACAWLTIDANDMNFQYGSYRTMEYHDWARTLLHNRQKITFKRAYSATPKVVVWLNVINLGDKVNWRIKTFATHVTATGFTIHIDTWSNTKLYSAMASWVAYPTDLPRVASGSFSTHGIQSSIRPQVFYRDCEVFPTGVFDEPPTVFLALNALDIDCTRDLRLLVKAENVSAASMTWHLDAWSDTILYSAGASYIAFR